MLFLGIGSFLSGLRMDELARSPKKLPRLTLGSGGESESLFNPLLPLEYSARLIQPVCWRERVDSYRAP